MIIRLSGADFSVNNIGKINIKRELSYDTKEILSKYTKSLTESQQFAVQDFIDGLKENGIWSYIGNLYLPILANDLSESMLNVKTLENDFTSPDSQYYKIGNSGGLTTTDSIENIPKENRVSVKLNASQLNHHLMMFPMKSFETSGEEGLAWLSKVNAQRTLDLSGCEWKTNSSDGNKVIFDGSSLPRVNREGKILIGLDFLSDKPYAMNGTYEDSHYTGGYHTSVADNTYTNEPVHILTNFNTRAKNEYGLISLGTGIPKELLNTYGELTKTFFDIFSE